MIKFILHGGAVKAKVKRNNQFFKEMVKNNKEPARILLVYFAKDKKRWPAYFEEDEKRFSGITDKKITFNIASDKISDLTAQIINADIIYFRGGDTRKLLSYIKKVRNLKKLLNYKVVAGSSAGALILAKYYYNNDDNFIGKGLNILPVKIICHYKTNLSKVKNKLIKYKEKLPLYTLKEKDFKVITVQ